MEEAAYEPTVEEAAYEPTVEGDGIWRMAAGGVVPGRKRSKSATTPSSSLHSCEHPKDHFRSSQQHR